MPLTLYWHTLLALFFIAAGVLPASAQTVLAVPALSGRVIDQTQTLSASELQVLNQRLQGLEEKYGTQVVVLMVPSTAPEDIAAYAHRVASDWKIGRRDVGDGVLVLVAKNDRRMRIEVARTLEGAIPDLAAAAIIDDAMAPRFRTGDYAGGIGAAVDHLSARISGEALPPPVRSKAAGSQDRDWNSMAVFLFFGVTLLGPVVRRFLGQRLGAVVVGTGAGALAYWLTVSMLLAGVAAAAGLLITLLSNSKGGGPFIGGGGRRGGGGGFGGGGGGGFSSGGGGSFGGGGASGSW